MKVAKPVLPIIAFIGLSLILALHFGHQQIQRSTQSTKDIEQVLAVETQKGNPRFPVHLTIPAISVNAYIQHLGVTDKGKMEVPDNTIDVGWFKIGPQPGEKGSAVIAGHYNGESGETGVFSNLYKLKPGDTIYVTNDLGTNSTFVVRESRIYNPGYAEEVFSPNDNGTHLNLVTCTGTWDEAKKDYSKRLIVFADIID